jgi:hypothetical protein
LDTCNSPFNGATTSVPTANTRTTLVFLNLAAEATYGWRKHLKHLSECRWVKCRWSECFGAADDLIFLSSKVLDPSFEFHFAEKKQEIN